MTKDKKRLAPLKEIVNPSLVNPPNRKDVKWKNSGCPFGKDHRFKEEESRQTQLYMPKDYFATGQGKGGPIGRASRFGIGPTLPSRPTIAKAVRESPRKTKGFHRRTSSDPIGPNTCSSFNTPGPFYLPPGMADRKASKKSDFPRAPRFMEDPHTAPAKGPNTAGGKKRGHRRTASAPVAFSGSTFVIPGVHEIGNRTPRPPSALPRSAQALQNPALPSMAESVKSAATFGRSRRFSSIL